VKLCAVIGAALVTVAVAATPALAVDEGVPDRDGHPYVGAIGVDPDGDGPQTLQIWCSGSVISESVFLNAAHCIVAQPAEASWSRPRVAPVSNGVRTIAPGPAKAIVFNGGWRVVEPAARDLRTSLRGRCVSRPGAPTGARCARVASPDLKLR
jgi:hypothetical protein